jgi:hypothetical protein
MKGFLAAIAGFAIGVPITQAAVVWQGEAVIDTATSQCGADKAIGPLAERVLKTVLRPKDVSDNGVNTTVTFIANQITMFAMVLDHGAMPAGTAAVFGNDSSGVIKANVGVPYTDFVQQPAPIVLTTENATVSGRITNFLYISGCDVTFRAAYSKRND